MAEQLAAVEPMVRGICRSRLGAADGDDAAQRTMVTLWRRLQAGHQIQSLPAYAAVCARYEVVSSLGEFQRRPTVAIGEATERACVDGAPGPEAQILRAADVAVAAARVEELLGKLTPAQAEVMRATKLADAEPDTAAAARELGITASSVRTAQARAMARLRELCGTRSPNPLASAVPEAQRRRASWAERTAARAAERMAHPSPAQAEFAAEFLRRRLDGGLSQSQLGAALGCDGSYVSKVERGKTWPSREFARRVDEALATGEAFQDRHNQHYAETTRADAEPAAGAAEPGDTDTIAAESTRADDPVTGATATDGSPSASSSAAVACAIAHAAVRAAATRIGADAQDDECAAQLTRWHADDHHADADADGWDDTAGDHTERADANEAEAVAS